LLRRDELRSTRYAAFKGWLPGIRPPRWALEVVFEDRLKNYDPAPAKCPARWALIADAEATLHTAA
jgi:hypothetical protein